MFCPNCGKDCGDGKFCSSCGTKLFQETEEQPFEMNDSYAIPKGEFKGYGSYMKLEENAFVIHNQFALGKQIRIPYNQITGVLYVRPEKKLLSNGYLFVRWLKNRDRPMPIGYARRCDKCSVSFGFLHDPVFYHIYCLLKTLALPTAQFQMEVPKPKMQDLENLARRIHIDPYFEKYNPMRSQAIGALCDELGMNLATATEIIDRAFDIRQQELYRNEPSAAIRDLNRILMKNFFVDYK